MNELHIIIMKLITLEMKYSRDSKASKRCFCNQFEAITREYIKEDMNGLIEVKRDANS